MCVRTRTAPGRVTRIPKTRLSFTFTRVYAKTRVLTVVVAAAAAAARHRGNSPRDSEYETR